MAFVFIAEIEDLVGPFPLPVGVPSGLKPTRAEPNGVHPLPLDKGNFGFQRGSSEMGENVL